MRFARIAAALGTAGIGILFLVGCASTSRAGRVSDASTPQEKAHADQLSEMGRQDGESAEAAARKPEVRRPAASRRQSGQGVIDQPIRK